MADPKEHAALLLALGAPKGMGKADSDSAGEPDDIEATAAADAMDAIKNRDASGLQDALHRFVVSCMSSYDKDDEGAPESER